MDYHLIKIIIICFQLHNMQCKRRCFINIILIFVWRLPLSVNYLHTKNVPVWTVLSSYIQNTQFADISRTSQYLSSGQSKMTICKTSSIALVVSQIVHWVHKTNSPNQYYYIRYIITKASVFYNLYDT